MHIDEVALTVTGLAAAALVHQDVLELPVAEQPGQVTVTIGSSRLVLREGGHFAGVHHLAIGITPADFDVARGWLSRRVEPMTVDGSEVIEGPEGWNSRSLYFLGPEDIVLELIAMRPGLGLGLSVAAGRTGVSSHRDGRGPAGPHSRRQLGAGQHVTDARQVLSGGGDHPQDAAVRRQQRAAGVAR